MIETSPSEVASVDTDVASDSCEYDEDSEVPQLEGILVADVVSDCSESDEDCEAAWLNGTTRCCVCSIDGNITLLELF